MIDLHSHSKLSHDGKISITNMVACAKAKGIAVFAITEHCDRDYLYCHFKERLCKQINLQKYQKEFFKVKNATTGIDLLFGIECGYSEKAIPNYVNELPKHPFDVIINSVHTIFDRDVYFVSAFKHTTEDAIITEYLRLVLASVNAPYDYDIIAHFGYVMRYTPYPNKDIYRDKYTSMIDEILLAIINKDKCLELNSHIKSLAPPCLPQKSILMRYRELGGTKISYGSDAHITERLGERYAEVVALAKECGFTHFTYYKNREPFSINF